MGGMVVKRGTLALGLGSGMLLALAGCGTTVGGDGERASPLASILYAGTTVPPAAPLPVDDVFCPPVEVIDGGAAIQTGSPDGAIRSQVSLGQLARECQGRPDGSTLVKVGVQGQAVLATAGGGRFDVPVRVIVKSGSSVFATRVRRTGISIPAGGSRGEFAIVEEGIVVPASAANGFTIEVGLGGAPTVNPAPRTRG